MLNFQQLFPLSLPDLWSSVISSSPILTTPCERVYFSCKSKQGAQLYLVTPTLLLLGICSIFDIVLNLTLKVCLYLKKMKSNCFQRGRLFGKLNFYCPVETLRRDFKMAVSIIKKTTWVSVKCRGSGKKITCKATYVHFPGRTYSLPSKVVTCCPSMIHLAGQMFSEHRHFPLSHILWREWGIFQCFLMYSYIYTYKHTHTHI